MSPFVQRDFLPVEACARLIARLAAAPPGGIVNVGSGIGLPTGRLALWIIEGYGRGELVIASPAEKDAFLLDVSRLERLCGAPCSYDELRRSCLALGRRLAAEPLRPRRGRLIQPDAALPCRPRASTRGLNPRGARRDARRRAAPGSPADPGPRRRPKPLCFQTLTRSSWLTA